jgi:hypothetical protein
MAPLLDYTDRLRRLRPLWYVPDFDPASGGTASYVLFLFEKPGPMTDDGKGSGLLSACNDDPTAAAAHAFLARNSAHAGSMSVRQRDPLVGRHTEDQPRAMQLPFTKLLVMAMSDCGLRFRQLRVRLRWRLRSGIAKFYEPCPRGPRYPVRSSAVLLEEVGRKLWHLHTVGGERGKKNRL